MTHRARKRLALLVLLVGLPAYIILVVSFVNWLDRTYGRLPIWAEVPFYACLAIAWIMPLKPVFKGIGQPGTDQK